MHSRGDDSVPKRGVRFRQQEARTAEQGVWRRKDASPGPLSDFNSAPAISLPGGRIVG